MYLSLSYKKLQRRLVYLTFGYHKRHVINMCGCGWLSSPSPCYQANMCCCFCSTPPLIENSLISACNYLAWNWTKFQKRRHFGFKIDPRQNRKLKYHPTYIQVEDDLGTSFIIILLDLNDVTLFIFWSNPKIKFCTVLIILWVFFRDLWWLRK